MYLFTNISNIPEYITMANHKHNSYLPKCKTVTKTLTGNETESISHLITTGIVIMGIIIKGSRKK